MQSCQRSFMRLEHSSLLGSVAVVHLALPQVPCNVISALQRGAWSRSFHIAYSARLPGCMSAESHSRLTPDNRVTNKAHHRAAFSVAATQAYTLHHSFSGPCIRLFGAAPTHQHRFVPPRASGTTSAYWMCHSPNQFLPPHETASSVVQCMRGMHAGAVQEEDEEEEGEPEADEKQLFHEELTFDAEGFAVAHALTSHSGDSERAAAAEPAARHEVLLDSFSGLLCILQLLPDEASEWIAKYLGFHSVAAIVALRGDLDLSLIHI